VPPRAVLFPYTTLFRSDLFGVGGRTGRGRGADIAARVEIDLAEVATGTKREVPFGVAVPCGRCGGNGAEPDTAIQACPTCGGTRSEEHTSELQSPDHLV